MAATKSGDFKLKLALGDVDVSKMYLGDVKVYSAGSTVTYYIDPTNYAVEEWDSDLDVLTPSTFVPTKSGWTFVGWREDTTASASVLTEKVMDDEPIVLYAVFTQNVTVTYYNGSTTKSTSTKKRYYNNGNTVNPSFTLSQASLSGWTARGWSTSATANSSIKYANATSFTISSNVTLYGLYQRTLTLSYNGNGSTSGSTSSQTGTQYYSSNGTYVNPTFTLRTNGFARTYYKFVKWASGSASGTQYEAGADVTLNANRIFYAVWIASVWITGSQFVLDPKTWNVESGNATPKGNGSTQINVYGDEANVRTGKFAVSTLRTLTFNVTYGENDTNGIARLELHDQNNKRITALDIIWNQNGGFTKTYTVTIPNEVTSICFFASMKNYKWWIINSAVLS